MSLFRRLRDAVVAPEHSTPQVRQPGQGKSQPTVRSLLPRRKLSTNGLETGLNKRIFSWAALALASTTFLSACGGGGGGGVSSDGGASAAAQQAPSAVAGYTAVSSTVSGGLGYPFGSHQKAYVAGVKPTSATQAAQDAVIRTQYDKWKAAGVQSACGGSAVTFNSSYLTVSEGAGYGMLLSVVMAGYDGQARDLFDGLFRVVRSHPAYNTGYPALMDWRVNNNCTSAGDGWNAMDGDLDIAMALLMADKQWGSSGTVNYKAEALATIAALKAYNMTSDGFTKGLPNAANNRTSDYMITHFKAFRRATGDTFWDQATDKAFYLLDLMQSRYAPNTGLVPDFVVNTGTNPAPSPGFIGDGNAMEGFYYWNACRLPWRLASDYVTSGDDRSRVVTGKMMDFFQSSSGGDPSRMQSGYRLDGTSLQNYPDPAFVGPATAGAMVDARFQPFLNSLWTFSAANLTHGYYGTELQLLSLIVATGNWWNP
jgi:endo-1,4-beta-D-glucanase Y